MGGVEVPFELGLDGHSDADVLLHAITDAILGAAALGDIGFHFPDTDPTHKDADSGILLEKVVHLVQKEGYDVNNIDATVAAQAPKLRDFIDDMRVKIAGHCGVSLGRVSVKATTTEKLGFVGSGEGMEAYAVCTLSARNQS